MEESNNKNGNTHEFLGKKRELPEIKLDSLSEDEEKIKKHPINNMAGLSKINPNNNICKICGKNEEVLKFEKMNDILNYINESKIQVLDNMELEKNKNIIFNIQKIICKKCFRDLINDKNKFIDFFYESIEIINDSSDVEAEIKIYEEQPILINEVDSSKNENESHKEDIINNNILSKNDKESQNNQNNKEEKHNNNIENNVQDIGKGEINNEIDNTNNLDNEQTQKNGEENNKLNNNKYE